MARFLLLSMDAAYIGGTRFRTAQRAMSVWPECVGPNVSECSDGSVNLSTQRQNPCFVGLPATPKVISPGRDKSQNKNEATAARLKLHEIGYLIPATRRSEHHALTTLKRRSTRRLENGSPFLFGGSGSNGSGRFSVCRCFVPHFVGCVSFLANRNGEPTCDLLGTHFCDVPVDD